ncbi:MAG TPA: trehalose-6-phosphate synthase [Ktedonobacterales bacterium]|nr:trehalose-6-phosphate synthase [Ktedonobacterales bacterium]
MMIASSEQQKRRLIIASNRGPIEHTLDKQGRLKPRRGAGGMVTALLPAARYAPPGSFTWIAVAMTDADRMVAENQEADWKDGNHSLTQGSAESANGHRRPGTSDGQEREPSMRYVLVPPEVYERHYERISNRILWFLHHYLWNTAEEPTFTTQTYKEWEQGYKQTNEAIAEAVCEEIQRDSSPALVMFQDYHLYLAPGVVRECLRRDHREDNVILQHFIHIPWPAVRYWQLLPHFMLHAIYQSLLANDIIGFQTTWDLSNFLTAVTELFPEARVRKDRQGGHISWQSHTTLARAYPISIDLQEVREEAARGARRYQTEMRRLLGEPTIVRVDRAEPTKNIVRGFQAFERVLQRRPDLVGKIKFLAFLVPSREGLPIYRRYQREIRNIIQRINANYARDGWKPIEIYFENNRARAMEAMRHYDVLLVNAVIDGMNLVAKEGPIVNQQDGVIILSETTGAARQLSEACLTVVPTDVEETTEALIRALEMPAAERHQRADWLRQSVEHASLEEWLKEQFADVEAVSQERAGQLTGQAGQR